MIETLDKPNSLLF